MNAPAAASGDQLSALGKAAEDYATERALAALYTLQATPPMDREAYMVLELQRAWLKGALGGAEACRSIAVEVIPGHRIP